MPIILKANRCLFIVILCAFTIFPTNIASAFEDKLIAVVNDELITLRDYTNYLNQAYSQLKLEGRPIEEIKMIMSDLELNGLQKLVEDKLIISEGQKKGVEVKEAAIQKRLTEIKSSYASERDFLDAILSEGSTVTDLRQKIEEQLTIKFVVDMEVRSKIVINPQEVTDYYNGHFEEFQLPARVKVDSIFVSNSTDPKETQAKLDKVVNVLSKLMKNKDDFRELAEIYSEAPPLGFIEKGQLQPIIEETIFKLKEGDISSIIEVNNGFYIFKVDKKSPPELAELEMVKEEISNLIFRKKFSENIRGWLDELKNNAFIEIKE
ncbi:MAG: peptidyl-prolyl cis-trans isomerase [Candidatus Omnitrophica bacterium]|nr:peptidyl-prolyl cis-trans isomerase [Candidatus Omnitrophota bacterium]